MGWESSDVVKFDLGLLLQDLETRTAKRKSAYNLLIIGPSFNFDSICAEYIY